MMQVAWPFSFPEQHCFLWEESSSLKPKCDLLEMSGSCTCNGRNAMLTLLPCGVLLILHYPLESCIRWYLGGEEQWGHAHGTYCLCHVQGIFPTGLLCIKPQVQRQNKELLCRNNKFKAFWGQCSVCVTMLVGHLWCQSCQNDELGAAVLICC